MRQWKMLSLCGLMMFAGLAVAHAAPPFGFAKPKSEIEWADDIFAAHKLAQAQNKPMLLVFGADWCGYCKKLEQQTLTNPQLVEYINKTYIAVHLDADKDEKVTEILEVKGLPCTIILSPDADLLGRIEGFHQPSAFYQKLATAKQAHLQVEARKVE